MDPDQDSQHCQKLALFYVAWVPEKSNQDLRFRGKTGYILIENSWYLIYLVDPELPGSGYASKRYGSATLTRR